MGLVPLRCMGPISTNPPSSCAREAMNAGQPLGLDHRPARSIPGTRPSETNSTCYWTAPSSVLAYPPSGRRNRSSSSADRARQPAARPGEDIDAGGNSISIGAIDERQEIDDRHVAVQLAGQELSGAFGPCRHATGRSGPARAGRSQCNTNRSALRDRRSRRQCVVPAPIEFRHARRSSSGNWPTPVARRSVRSAR